MLDAKRLGLAGGVLWAASLLAMAMLWLLLPDYATSFKELMMGVYPGFKLTAVGIILGMVWAFFDAFIGLFLLAWLYNRFGGES